MPRATEILNHCGRTVCVLSLLSASAKAFAQRYDITYLEIPYGIISAGIGDINNNGDVVASGYYLYSTDKRPLLWRDNVLIGLPLLREQPYSSSREGGVGFAYGINEAGQVVGQSDAFPFSQKAVLWPGGSAVIDLLDRSSAAADINDSGVIVGRYDNTGFRWENGQWDSLAPLRFVPTLNNFGQIIGYDGTRAYLWDQGQITTLPSLGGADWARAINDAGQIVGSSGAEGLPVLWENGTIRELPHFGIGAWGLSINELGEIGGNCFLAPGETRSVLWRHNLLMNLNDLTVEPLQGDRILDGGTQINDRGQIATQLVSQSAFRAAPVRLEPVDIGLTLWGIQPSRPGQRNTIEIHHVTPNGRVMLLWGTTRGEPQSFEQCSGAMIDIADPNFAGTAVAGPDGVARVHLDVPAHIEGNYMFQAVDHTTCEVSPPAWALFKLAN